ANDEIHAAVAGEVPSDDAVPPAVALLEAGRGLFDESAVASVMKDGDGHPFADDDEIRSAVAINILPDGVGDNSDVRESRRCLVGDVGEFAVTIVLEQHALRIDAVTSRHATSADE